MLEFPGHHQNIVACAAVVIAAVGSAMILALAAACFQAALAHFAGNPGPVAELAVVSVPAADKSAAVKPVAAAVGGIAVVVLAAGNGELSGLVARPIQMHHYYWPLIGCSAGEHSPGPAQSLLQ
jgi:hypothetical protein